MTMVKLVDFSFGRPDPDAIVAAGIKGVLRYVGYPGDGGKGLTLDEVSAYHARGLGIGLVFEQTAGRILEGRDAGIEDARTCVRFGAMIGWPSELPFYFACDKDVTADDFPAIGDYLRGCGYVLGGPMRIGIYGEYDVINYCWKLGLAAWYWQALAWSGGKLHPYRHIYQSLNGQTLGGAEVDLDEGFGDDQGLWYPEEAEMADPRVDEIMMALTGDATDSRGVMANWNRRGGVPTGNSLLDGYVLQQDSINAIVAQLTASGAIVAGMTAEQVRAIVVAALTGAHIVP